LVNLLSPGKGFVTAFHDGHDRLLNPGFVNAANLDISLSASERTRAHLLRVA
jgi:hypothetical protein